MLQRARRREAVHIFIDFAGDAWLGVYGSSCRIAAVDSFTGGTPACQCSDISVQKHACICTLRPRLPRRHAVLRSLRRENGTKEHG